VQGVDVEALEKLPKHHVYEKAVGLVDVVRLRGSFQDAADREAIRQLAANLCLTA
jgi:hypothetical protein